MDKFWNFIKNEETEETELYFEGPISTESWLGDEITPALFRDELAKVSGRSDCLDQQPRWGLHLSKSDLYHAEKS